MAAQTILPSTGSHFYVMECKRLNKVAFEEVTWITVAVVSDIQESVVNFTGTVWVGGFTPGDIFKMVMMAPHAFGCVICCSY
ncbi:MAG: hypothetical protein KAR76_05665 [Methanosarcinales archaeon]|nr:hypothetical protein [Methanosarcinales archaeon]